MKRLVKGALQYAAAEAAPWLWRRRRQPTLLVLMYHRVLPADHPDRATEQPGMYVSPQTLDMQMALLKEVFTLVHLDDWLRDVSAGKPVPTHACAITFDDGWRDNHEHAFPILQRHAAPATVYLVTDLVGRQYSFWPNTLAKVLMNDSSDGRAQLPVWLREMAEAHGIGDGASAMQHVDALINVCKETRSDAQMLEALEPMASQVAAGARDLMDWSEIRHWHDAGLVRFGSHTRRHTRLTKVVDAAELTDEIVGSRDALTEQLGVIPQTFCYPNGDVSEAAHQLVRANFKGAVTTARGWNQPTSDAWLLNRVGVHEDVSSARRPFLARLAGIG